MFKELDAVNEKEQRLLELLRQNPFLSQQDMAEQLQMSRPAIANMISALTKRGLILGRAYVFPEAREIVCIGGANLDRKLHIKGEVCMATSNPATMEETVGGVARNIAENLGRLGQAVRLVTVVGQDADWTTIEEQSSAFMNVASVEQVPDVHTGTYTAILNEDGELVLATADMDIYDRLLPDVLQKHEQQLLRAKYIVADLNCPKETIMYLQQLSVEHELSLIIVPVSSPKMVHLPEHLVGIEWLICNHDEAEFLTKSKLEVAGDFEKALERIQQMGAKNVLITNGSHDVWLRDTSGVTVTKAVQFVEHIVDVTGAGDSFVGAFIYGLSEQKSMEEALHVALANARATIQSPHTVRKNLTKAQLEMEAN